MFDRRVLLAALCGVGLGALFMIPLVFPEGAHNPDRPLPSNHSPEEFREILGDRSCVRNYNKLVCTFDIEKDNIQ
jgi:hypothetical protein